MTTDKSFSTGHPHAFGRVYFEPITNTPIRYTDRVDVTVPRKPVVGGTELHVAQAGIHEMIPPEMYFLGCQQSMMQLAAPAEPEIAA